MKISTLRRLLTLAVLGLTTSTLFGQVFQFTTPAGSAGQPGYVDATGAAARFNRPTALATDAAGNVYVSEAGNATIRRVTPAGVVTTLVALPNVVAGLAVDSAGNVIVADAFGHVIRKVTPAGVVSVIAGSPGISGSADGTPAAARFSSPAGVTVDTSGNIYVADTGNHTIRKIAVGGAVTTVAGLAGVNGSANGSGAVARFYSPEGLVIAPSGNLFVADTGNSAIRRISTSAEVTTFAGTTGYSGFSNGTGTAARFYFPRGLALDAAGNLYTGDYYYNTVRKITPAAVVTTIGGSPNNSGSVDGLDGSARFNYPTGFAVDSAGNLFIADSQNHVLRRGTPIIAVAISSQPGSVGLVAGQTTTFSVAATGTAPITYQWQRRAAETTDFVQLNDGGAYSGATTAALTVTGVAASMHGDQFRCLVDNAAAAPALSGVATLSINAAPVITSAATANFYAGLGGNFTVTATGFPAPVFSVTTGALPTWAAFNPTTGVLTGTPPTTSGSPFSFTITAANGVGAAATQAFSLTVAPTPVAPTISSFGTVSTAVTAGQSVTLSASATGTAPLTYRWKRNGVPISGATTSSYTFAASATRDNGYYQLVVTNPAGSSVSAVTFINVLPAQPQVVAWGGNSNGQTALPTGGVGSAVAVAAGTYHSLALRADGTVIAWGYNYSGQCDVPASLSNVVAIAAGASYSLALRSDGTVVGWGDSYGGSVPGGLTGVVAIAAGGAHALALKADGTVVAWGYNYYGQTTVPTGLSGAIAIAAGGQQSLALLAGGTVVAWGESSSAAVPPGLFGVVAIAAGSAYGLAIKVDGSVATWGNYNYYTAATAPAGLAGVVALSARDNTALALKSDGTVTGWGSGNGVTGIPAQLRTVVGVAAGTDHGVGLREAVGDLAPTISSSPASVAGNLGQAVELTVAATAGTAALNYQWYKDTAAIEGATSATYAVAGLSAASTGQYYAVVSTSRGSSASGIATVSTNSAPVLSTTAGGRYPLTTGQSLTMSLSSAIPAGATIQWRRNGQPVVGATSRTLTITNATIAQAGYYQAVFDAGAGSVATAALFVPVSPASTQVLASSFANPGAEIAVPLGLTDAVKVAARYNVSAAVRANGTVTFWGIASYYTAAFAPPASLANVVDLCFGSPRFFALRGDGSVVSWGDSYYASLWSPPTGLSGVVAITAGNNHALALKRDGTVTAWGPGGNTTSTNVTGWRNIIAVAAGDYYSLGLQADGTVVTAGSSSNSVASQVPAGLSGVTAIAGGGDFALALKGDGTVVGWGSSYYGGAAVPSGLTDAVAIAAGSNHGLALRRDGTAIRWGGYYNADPSATPLDGNAVFALAGGSYHTLLLRDSSGDRAPTISTQPAGGIALTGQSATLRVTASAGTAGIAYQWRRNGLTLPGASGATLTLSEVSAANAGDYDVMTFNYLGVATSQVATLTVSPTTALTVIPVGRQVVAAGQPVTLTATSNLSGTVTYQWRRNGRAIAGATNATFSLTSARWRDGGVYQVVATNAVGSALGAATFLGVNAPTQVLAWGSGNSYYYYYAPQTQTIVPAGLTDALAIAAGNSHSLALKADGTVAGWGEAAAGLTTMGSLSNVVAVAAGPGFSVALTGDGAVTTAGNIGAAPATATNIVAIAAPGAGYSDSLYAVALKRDGTVVAWGTGGAATDVPADLANVVAVSVGGSQRLALKADGTVVRWGSASPALPVGLSGVVAIASGAAHHLALKADGTVVAWSANNYYGEANVPAGLNNVTAIAAGSQISFALKADGTIVAWGYTGSGLTTLPAVEPALAVSAGSSHALALRDSANDVAPTIAAVSTNQTVNVGQPLTLSVAATGTPPPSYQWYRDGVALSGATGASYNLLSATTATAGSYTVVVYNARGTVTSSSVVVTVTGTADTRALIAGALRANTGGGGLLGTFTIEGTASKQLLVRAVGPALAGFGVAGPLANPQLTISTAAGVVVVSNDDWNSAANATAVASVSAQVGAFALPAEARDSAVLRSFAPGTYHVRVTGASGGAGVTLFQVYDADNAPRLVYLAANAFAGAGADVMVQGFSLTGVTAGRSYLVRALGPTLARPGALADPRLGIFDAAGAQVAANDDWGGGAALVTLAERVGAMPLATGSKDAAVSFVPTTGGTYTVQVGGAGTTTGSVLIEVFEADAQRAETFAPAIVAPPESLTVLAGQPATLGVVATGRPAPAYQWKKGSTTLSGATNATYVIAATATGDAADYTVTATNSAGAATSAPATLTLSSQLATHNIVGSGYIAGATATITNTITYVGAATSLGWQVTLPAGWSFAADAGSPGDVKPTLGATGTLEWAWTTPPASPVTFSYTVNVPATETGPRHLAATAIMRIGTAAAATTAAVPGLLAVDVAPAMHSADTDLNSRLSLLELTRVIELFNTRNGTQRTGAYGVATTLTEDGFVADATRANAATATLARYHTGDANRDGKISLLELTRMIEIFNYRTGTQRTGQYHVKAGTEDGFDPGP